MVADCIASLVRWGKRDALGQRLAQATESWTAVNDKTFRLKLKRPFPLTLQALGELLAHASRCAAPIRRKRLEHSCALQQ